MNVLRSTFYATAFVLVGCCYLVSFRMTSYDIECSFLLDSPLYSCCESSAHSLSDVLRLGYYARPYWYCSHSKRLCVNSLGCCSYLRVFTTSLLIVEWKSCCPSLSCRSLTASFFSLIIYTALVGLFFAMLSLFFGRQKSSTHLEKVTIRDSHSIK